MNTSDGHMIFCLILDNSLQEREAMVHSMRQEMESMRQEYDSAFLAIQLLVTQYS